MKADWLDIPTLSNAVTNPTITVLKVHKILFDIALWLKAFAVMFRTIFDKFMLCTIGSSAQMVSANWTKVF